MNKANLTKVFLLCGLLFGMSQVQAAPEAVIVAERPNVAMDIVKTLTINAWLGTFFYCLYMKEYSPEFLKNHPNHIEKLEEIATFMTIGLLVGLYPNVFANGISKIKSFLSN